MNERERFEAAMQAQGYKPYNFEVAMVGGPYRNSHVQAAYEGWQAALADRPEPAQPVATVVDAPMCRANTSWAIDVQLPVGTKLYTAPPSHPAEAAPERQYGRTLLAATALVQWWERAKNPPLPNDWNAHLGRLQEDLMAAVNAQPAKGEGKP